MNADVHALAGAFALDALPPDEAAAFREHLAQCSACQDEVAELHVTAAHLGVAVAERPPPRVREAVLRAASQTRQLPPTTRVAAATERHRPRRRVWLAAAAAAVVVAAGSAGLTATLDDDGSAPVAQDPVARVVTAPDADVEVARLRGGGRLTVVASEQVGQAVVLSKRLPPVGTDETYQLWLVDPDGEARSADVLIDAPGAANLVRSVRPGDQVAITREPAGGSEQPSMAPLAVTDPV
jgi:anti-sigma-K factor RskA